MDDRSRPSKPLWGYVVVLGGFDPHALPPIAMELRRAPETGLSAFIRIAPDLNARPWLLPGCRAIQPAREVEAGQLSHTLDVVPIQVLQTRP